MVLCNYYYFRINRPAGPEAKHPGLDPVFQSSDALMLLGPQCFGDVKSGPPPHKMPTVNTAPRSSHCGSVVTNPTSNHEDAGLIPGLTQWVKDSTLLWLWCRLAAAALIRPWAWEFPQSVDAALKSKTNKQNPQTKKQTKKTHQKTQGT